MTANLQVRTSPSLFDPLTSFYTVEWKDSNLNWARMKPNRIGSGQTDNSAGSSNSSWADGSWNLEGTTSNMYSSLQNQGGRLDTQSDSFVIILHPHDPWHNLITDKGVAPCQAIVTNGNSDDVVNNYTISYDGNAARMEARVKPNEHGLAFPRNGTYGIQVATTTWWPQTPLTQQVTWWPQTPVTRPGF